MQTVTIMAPFFFEAHVGEPIHITVSKNKIYCFSISKVVQASYPGGVVKTQIDLIVPESGVDIPADSEIQTLCASWRLDQAIVVPADFYFMNDNSTREFKKPVNAPNFSGLPGDAVFAQLEKQLRASGVIDEKTYRQEILGAPFPLEDTKHLLHENDFDDPICDCGNPGYACTCSYKEDLDLPKRNKIERTSASWRMEDDGKSEPRLLSAIPSDRTVENWDPETGRVWLRKG